MHASRPRVESFRISILKQRGVAGGQVCAADSEAVSPHRVDLCCEGQVRYAAVEPVLPGRAVPEGATALEEVRLDGRRITAWISTEAADPSWDLWLQQSPLGQFQQSAWWAQAKAVEGWSAVRVLLTADEERVGGFQLLWRKRRLVRFGYVSKGPVLPERGPELHTYAQALLQKVARRFSLQAMVVQPPDFDPDLACRQPGFLRDCLGRVNDATWIIDLRDGFAALERRMHKVTRQRGRRGVAAGLRIREGGLTDLETFFRLMLASCRRQQVQPSPASLGSLLGLWEAAAPSGNLRLYFAEAEGRPIAAHLDLLFGRTLTFWKKGWDASMKEASPNDFCLQNGIRWACDHGYHRCDFTSFSRPIAEAWIGGKTLSQEQSQSRYMFFVRFGGAPLLLAPASICIPNRALRAGYRLRFRRQLRAATEAAATEL